MLFVLIIAVNALVALMQLIAFVQTGSIMSLIFGLLVCGIIYFMIKQRPV